MDQPYRTPAIHQPQTATAGKFQPIRMEADVIIQRVSKGLYAHPASGFRELFANEIVAAMRAWEAGADPRIEATITPDKIMIWGRDSLGIERQVFDEIYMCLGRSGNFDSARPGQFGLGRAAYTTIADRILIETHHRDGDRYTALGIEGRGYQVDVGGTDIEYGTRVTMVPAAAVRDNQDTMDAILLMANRMASRTHIPVTISTPDGTLAGRYKSIDSEGGMYASLPDVEFSASPMQSDDYYAGTAATAYLCGVPIEFEYSGRFRLRSITLDIRDEIKYPPTPDRERLTADAQSQANKLIDDEIGRRIAAVPAGIADAVKHPDTHVLYPLLDDERLDRKVPVYGSGVKCRVGMLNGSPILNCRAFLRHKISAVLAEFPNATFVRRVPEIESLDGFMERNRIDPKKRDAAGRSGMRKEIILHGGRYALHCTEEEAARFLVYRVDGRDGLSKYDMLCSEGNGIRLTVHKCASAVHINDAIRDALATKFLSSDGVVTGEYLVRAADDFEVRLCNSERLLETWSRHDGKGVFGEILVMTDGINNHKYDILGRESYGIGSYSTAELYGHKWALEAYLRLDNPVYREIVKKCVPGIGAEICSKLLALEGKPGVADR